MKAIKIVGVEDCIRMFEKAPQNIMKISQKAMKQASKATAKQMRQGIPKRWRKLIKYKVKNTDGKISARIGLYNTHLATGYQPKNGKTFDWFKAYWANYGTLKHRDRSHQFQYDIKKNVRRRRNNEGQPAQNFFENAIQEWESVFMNEFEKEVQKHEDEIYNR